MEHLKQLTSLLTAEFPWTDWEIPWAGLGAILAGLGSFLSGLAAYTLARKSARKDDK